MRGPGEGGVIETAQLETPAVAVGARLQVPEESAGSPERGTVPDGNAAVPPACVSETVAVTEVGCPTTIGFAPKPTDVGVCRPATVMWKVRVADWGIGLVWSGALIVKSKTPEPVGGPEIGPPGESVRPPGRAPDTSVQVSRPLPPCAVS